MFIGIEVEFRLSKLCIFIKYDSSNSYFFLLRYRPFSLGNNLTSRKYGILHDQRNQLKSVKMHVNILNIITYICFVLPAKTFIAIAYNNPGEQNICFIDPITCTNVI